MKNDDSTIEFDEQILLPSEGESLYPLRTVPKNEFKLRDYCREKGILAYLPVRKEWKIVDYVKGKDKKHYSYRKIVFRPMFASYLFVRVNEEQKAQLWATKKVIRVLKPASQEQLRMELRAVRAFELTGLEQEIEFNAEVKEGMPFVIDSGVWSGVTGWLVKKRKCFEWTVRLEFANQYVKTIIDPSTLVMRPLEK